MTQEVEKVIVFSNEPWGNIWYSKHHYANELSKLGHTVYFVNPSYKWRFSNLFSFRTTTNTINKNLIVVNYKNNFPITIFKRFFSVLNDIINSYKLTKVIHSNEKILVWQFDVFRFEKLFFFPNQKRIWHVTDPLMWHSNDNVIAKYSDLIVCTSISHIEYYTSRHPSKKVIHVPHGISEDEFYSDIESVEAIKRKYNDFLLLVGTINESVEFTLLEEIAKKATIPLLIIGSDISLSAIDKEKWERLKSIKNIVHIGVVPGQEIKNWISASKICIVAYNFNHPHQSSLKILNYLAGQKPIVSTLDGEFLELKNKAIFTAKNIPDFIKILQDGIENKLDVNRDSITTELIKRKYSSLISQILKHLETETVAHVVFTMANQTDSVPYFNWFAEAAYRNKKIKITFVALCNNIPKMIEDVGEYGWDCHWIYYDHQHQKRGTIKAFFQLCRLFKKLKPDVVHTHLFDDSLPGLIAARLAGIKKRIITKGDTTFHYFHTPEWVKADQFNNWNATHIIPPSKEAERFIVEVEKAPVNKITMIHHGIPPEIFTKQSEEYQSALIQKYQLEGKKVIGTVARLIEWKGYRYIIEAIPNVVKKYPNAQFLFVGTGDQKEELIALAKKHHVLDYIIFTGWVERNYIPSLYSLLDVYVHAASFEPFGFVIPEAMMSGAPIVSTPTGAALDIIKHKENGYLAKYKDADSLAEGICFALENGIDFKEKAKQKALEMYNFELMYSNFIKLYENN
ncbi:MAG: glycosyltransferase [Flavobacteriales bacterium]|nr:glycosyltransferase [Flavobacteriales bacterium]